MGAAQQKYFTNYSNENENRHSSGSFAGVSTPTVAEYPNLIDLVRQTWRGFGKLYVVGKYLVHSIKYNLFEKPRVPYFKLGILAAAMFIVFKEDLHFTLNLKVPTWLIGSSSSTTQTPDLNQLGVAQSISLPQTIHHKTTENTPASEAEQIEFYIKRFRRIAITEMQQFGIPASIKMAQALLESQAGSNHASLVNNNHFGAPLSNTPIATAWENWRAHSLYLRNEHPELFKYGMNYKRWAKALEKMDYNQMDDYGQHLIDVIDQYQLAKLDEVDVKP